MPEDRGDLPSRKYNAMQYSLVFLIVITFTNTDHQKGGRGKKSRLKLCMFQPETFPVTGGQKIMYSVT